ncbi:MAG: hypothetical protein QOH59_2551 [Gemmatimonadales bacterium]|nr:hypothetical protein [Gemmatimonadales bacterium]
MYSQLSGAVMVLTMTLFSAPLRPTPRQGSAIGYTANQLDCARFLEISESRILTEAGGRRRNQTSTRRGVWQFRAAPSHGGVGLEGWLDTLVLTRRSPETAISPDTDGLLGGRYRGTLSRTGIYTSSVRPFVPDEVAEIAEMSGALDDFFPAVPARALGPGEEWTDSLGLTIRRLPDSVHSGVSLLRYALESRKESKAAPTPADSLPLKLSMKTEERGEFVWHPVRGLLRRDRRIVVETTVPPSRSVRQAVRSKVEQRITVARDLTKMSRGDRQIAAPDRTAGRPDSGVAESIRSAPGCRPSR